MSGEQTASKPRERGDPGQIHLRRRALVASNTFWLVSGWRCVYCRGCMAEPTPTSETPPPPAPHDVQASDRQVGYMLDTARFLLDEQFKVAERLDNKARGLAIITAGFFAATLAAALGVAARSNVATGWVIAIAIGGGIAAVGLAKALWSTAAAVKVTPENFIGVARLQKDSSWAYQGHPLVGKNLIDLTLSVAADRVEENQKRSGRVKTAGCWCLTSTAATTLELLVIFAATAFAT